MHKRKRELEKGLDKISTHKSALDAIKNINGIQSKSRQIIQRQRTNHSQQEHKYIVYGGKDFFHT